MATGGPVFRKGGDVTDLGDGDGMWVSALRPWQMCISTAHSANHYTYFSSLSLYSILVNDKGLPFAHLIRVHLA